MAETALSDTSVVFMNNLFKAMTIQSQIDISFDGSGSVLNFIEALEEYFQLYSFTDAQKLSVAARALKGKALKWYTNLGKQIVLNESQGLRTKKLFELLKKLYLNKVDKVALQTQFYGERQLLNEETSEFLFRKIELAKKLEIPTDTVWPLILERLRPEIQDYFEGKEVESLQEAYELAVQYDNRRKDYGKFVKSSSNFSYVPYRNYNSYSYRNRSYSNFHSDKPSYNEQMACKGQRYQNEYQGYKYDKNNYKSENVYQNKIRDSKQYEHSDNYRKNYKGRYNFKQNRNEGDWRNDKNENWRNNSNEKQKDFSRKKSQINAVKLSNVKLPSLVVRFEGYPIEALLDTGSQKSFISLNLYKKCFSRNHELDFVRDIEVTSAQGEHCHILGQTTAEIVLQDEKILLTVFVMKNLQNSLILGADFLKLTNAVLDFKKNEVNLDLGPQEKDNIQVPELSIKSEILSNEEKNKVENLMKNFRTLFREDPGLTHIVTHSIDTGDNKPVFSRPYRYDKMKEEIIEKHIEDMLQKKIIIPVKSAWASPIVLHPKKNDYPKTDPKAWRFCVDYRKLNEITQFPRYPLPVIEDTIRNIKTTNFMSTLDLNSGYFQIAMSEKDLHKTAFVSHKGTYAFTRLPFGLSGSPATFQALMDEIFKDVIGQFVWVYLDDVIIYSNSFDEHLSHLKTVFTLLQKAGLTINLKKCRFATKELKYLGFIITQEGIKADNSKIEAVQKFASPRNAKQLSSFLGMCSFYRTFIPNFSDIAEPLYKLRRKNTKFQWSDEAQLAFDKLKNTLVNAPVLKHLDSEKPLTIHTDASGVGVGAVLMQEERPIAFVSRTLNAAERRYTVTEREILAIVFALNKFKIYFNKYPVSVVTDHAALTRLYTGKNLSARVIRWALKLQEYNLIIVHKPGSQNKVADALSRNPLEDISTTCNMLTTTVLNSREKIIKEIKNDSEFAHIYKYLQDPDGYEEQDKNIIQSRAKDYEIIDELLFYIKKKNRFNEYRPVIPASLRMDILHDIHDIPIAGHPGIRKTFARAAESVYWPKMRQFIVSYVKSCLKCQLYNYINYRPAGFLNPVETSFPNEMVALDLLGPYPRSTLGNFRYVLVIVDHFSKWVELVPLKRASAKTVTDAFLKNYVLKYGAPVKLLSDNGPQFISQIFQNMCEKLDIRHSKIIPYRPQSNIAERVNRNVVNMISNFVGKVHSEWAKHLAELAFAIRTGYHETT